MSRTTPLETVLRLFVALLIVAGVLFGVSLTARAQDRPEIAWTDSTRLALAQCVVAEAGWRNRTEHSAIAHVLERRWRRFVERHPGTSFSFEDQVRAYCHIHRVPAADSSNGWALSLSWGPMIEDPGMGANVTWTRYRDDWDFVRETVELFERGELHDPMPLALIFGGHMDGADPSCVWLGPTTLSIMPETLGQRVLLHNRFYSVRETIARAAARGR